MTVDTAMQLASQTLWTGIFLVLPMLLIAMVVGILVSIIQVVTQIQDASLSFIPKILTVVIVLVVLGPWMLKRLVGYSASIIGGIPGYL